MSKSLVDDHSEDKSGTILGMNLLESSLREDPGMRWVILTTAATERVTIC